MSLRQDFKGIQFQRGTSHDRYTKHTYVFERRKPIIPWRINIYVKNQSKSMITEIWPLLTADNTDTLMENIAGKYRDEVKVHS